MAILVKLLPYVGLLVIIGIPLVYVIRTGRFKRAVFLTWGIMFLWYVLIGILGPSVVAQWDKTLALQLPDAPSAVAALFLGWIYGILVGGVGLFLRYVMTKSTATQNYSW